jgi:hypothetical protein
MTPVSRTDGLPFDALRGAVQLEPDGLRLLRAATLRIAYRDADGNTQSFTPGVQTTFGWRGAGDELHLQPPLRDDGGVAIPLLHFSGYGIADATQMQREAQLKRTPTSPEDQSAQKVETAIHAEQACATGGGACDPAKTDAAVIDPLRARWKTSLEPQLAAAEKDDALADQAISQGAAFFRLIALLGIREDFASEEETFWGQVHDILLNAYQAASTRCRTGDLSSYARLLQIARMGQLLGLPADVFAFVNPDECANYDVSIESSLTDSMAKTGPVPGATGSSSSSESWEKSVQVHTSAPARATMTDQAPLSLAYDKLQNDWQSESTLDEAPNATHKTWHLRESYFGSTLDGGRPHQILVHAVVPPRHNYREGHPQAVEPFELVLNLRDAELAQPERATSVLDESCSGACGGPEQHPDYTWDESGGYTHHAELLTDHNEFGSAFEAFHVGETQPDAAWRFTITGFTGGAGGIWTKHYARAMSDPSVAADDGTYERDRTEQTTITVKHVSSGG